MNQLTFNQPGPAGILYHAVVTEIFTLGKPNVWEVEYATTKADLWTSSVELRYFLNEDLLDESLRHYLSTGCILGGVSVADVKAATAAHGATQRRAVDPVALAVWGIPSMLMVAAIVAIIGIALGWWSL